MWTSLRQVYKWEPIRIRFWQFLFCYLISHWKHTDSSRLHWVVFIKVANITSEETAWKVESFAHFRSVRERHCCFCFWWSHIWTDQYLHDLKYIKVTVSRGNNQNSSFVTFYSLLLISQSIRRRYFKFCFTYQKFEAGNKTKKKL